MAVQTFEEILASAQLSAEERKLLDNIQQKAPALKEGWLRQDDYSRKTQELSTERKKFESDLKHAEEMKVWADRTVPIWESLVEQGVIDEESKPIWPEEKRKLEKDLEDARRAALAGGDMDPAELDKRVKAIVAESGLKLTAEEWKNVYASEGKKLVDEQIQAKYDEFTKDFNENRVAWLGGFTAGNTLAAIKYQTETGQPWTKETQKEFYEFMTKEGNFDPYEMSDKFIEPKTREKRTQEEIERKAQILADKKIADLGGMPGGGGEPFIPTGESRGSLQRMLDDSAAAEGDVESLAMAAGRKAAQELRTEGKGR